MSASTLRTALGPVVVMLFLLPSGAAQAESGPVERFYEGYLPCRAYAPAGHSIVCSPTNESSRTDFHVGHEADLVRVEITLIWTAAHQASPDRLAISSPDHPLLSNATVGVSPLQVAVDVRAHDAFAEPGSFRLHVDIPADRRPGVVHEQPFNLSIVLHHGVAMQDAPDRGPGPDADPMGAAPGRAPADAVQDAWGDGAPVVLVAAAGTALAAVAAGRWMLGRGAAPPLAAVVRLFSRLDEDEVADHPRRAAILEAVRARPGENAEAIRRRVALAPGTFGHHLRVLVKHRLVRRARVEGLVCLTPPDMAPRDAPHRPLRARVAARIRAEPGIDAAGLAARIKVRAARIRYHVRRLAREGRVRVEADGRRVRCYPR